MDVGHEMDPKDSKHIDIDGGMARHEGWMHSGNEGRGKDHT